VPSQLTTHTTLLARLAVREDTRAWPEFCARYGELIRSFARMQGLQPADCDDVLQNVLIGLSKAMPDFTYDPSKGKFRNYLKTFVMRAIYRRFREKRAAPRQLKPEGAQNVADDPAVDAIWEEQWREYHLRRAMQTIEVEFSRADREAFEAYAVEGRDARQVAAAVGMPVEQVYRAKSRILKRLGELVAQQVQEEG
jgi:RNA polymerase sigma-70 factor (ECF subfamily)